MERKLSVATGAKRLSLAALAITPMLLVASAIAASVALAAAPPKGAWTLRPGKTLNLTNMTISAGDLDVAYIYVDGSQYDTLGNNAGFQLGVASLFNYPYSNTSGQTQTVTVAIQDTSITCDPFFSDGPNAVATHRAFSITDGGGGCETITPTLGQGNFNGNVSINRTP
jgi:hypothetical protein